MTTISVITPSLPERWSWRAECIASVSRQEYQPLEHLVGLDYARSGVSEVLNRLARGAEGDVLAILADDDLLYPHHLGTLVALIEDGADIAYGYCDVQGRDGWNPNRPFDPALLRQGNYIPATALIRRSLVEHLGYWRSHRVLGHDMEDWDFWTRALDEGARFAYHPEPTWCYRFHGSNISTEKLR